MDRDGRTAQHLRVAREVTAELARDPGVQAVLLTGSVARGEHREDSDVDLLVIGEEGSVPFRRTVDALLVETIVHPAAQWRERFGRAGTSWSYAVSEALVLHDPHGAALRLIEEARRARAAYSTPPALRREMSTALWHARAKLQRAAEADARTRGYWASLCTETVIRALYVAHDVAVPAGSRLLDHLDALGPDPLATEHLHTLLTGTAEERFEAVVRMTQELRARLGPADHEPVTAGDGSRGTPDRDAAGE